ncbi:hypothetical protein WJX77_001649 [Trebouxia sp. C0004]
MSKAGEGVGLDDERERGIEGPQHNTGLATAVHCLVSTTLQESSLWLLAPKNEARTLQSHYGGLWFHHNTFNLAS